MAVIDTLPKPDGTKDAALSSIHNTKQEQELLVKENEGMQMSH